jgi:hypothetical protein
MDSVSNYQRHAKNTNDVRLRLILPHILNIKRISFQLIKVFWTKAKDLHFSLIKKDNARLISGKPGKNHTTRQTPPGASSTHDTLNGAQTQKHHSIKTRRPFTTTGETCRDYYGRSKHGTLEQRWRSQPSEEPSTLTKLRGHRPDSATPSRQSNKMTIQDFDQQLVY